LAGLADETNPPGAVVPELKPAPAPTPEPEQQVATPDPLSVPASPATGNGRPRAKERAEAREQLAYGPRHGDLVKRDAAEYAKISERTLIAAAERLGVRTQRGQWWLPPA